MPLLVFLVLGTLQLFMLLQARILTQHAAYRAVRAGSLNQGDCLPMMHSAIVAVLPTIAATVDKDYVGQDGPAANAAHAKELAKAFARHKDNRFNFGSHKGPVIEIYREAPLRRNIPGAEDEHFDDPDPSLGDPMNLEIRMVYWYYMRIPFANRLMSWIFLAHFGIRDFKGQNPLVFTQRDVTWKKAPGASLSKDSWPGGPLGSRMRNWSNQKHYLFPIEVNAVMRMMTPAARKHFNTQSCPVTVKP